MDLKQEALEVVGQGINNMIIFATPDKILGAVDELIKTVDNDELTGAEKFDWVLQEAKPLFYRSLKWMLMAIIQILVDDFKAKQKVVQNGN